MGKKTEVHAGQQHQGGGGNTFQKQVRRTGEKGKKGEKMSEKERRKQLYSKQAAEGKERPKANVHEEVFMSVCRCNGAGTCSVCVAQRKGKLPTAGKFPGNIRREEERMRRKYGWL
ncbi:MAG TPA: hypothetical protein VMV71_01995 [Candidatus Paceibacterota bacterium]|nr:hypothetical protein [Candidatus Paceibacterota bacterium]